jgi:HNH endonuclease
MLSCKRVREFFDYDISTGKFFWRFRRCPSKPAGSETGYVGTDGYVTIGMDYKVFKAHHLAWVHFYGEDLPKGFCIDHINGNRSDNRISNLRCIPRACNGQNIRKPYSNNKSSGVLGVYWHQCGKWQARIQINGKARSLGLYGRKDDASADYIAAKRELHPFGTI